MRKWLPVSSEPHISRRDLLRGRFGRGADAVSPDRTSSLASSARPLPVLHRPPGAVEEAAFLRECTRCDACVEACPVHAIVRAGTRFREAAGTPVIDASTQPCVMCKDAPCITVCIPRVLRAELPRRMGTARIQIESCLAHTRTTCTVCSERCPVEGAITVERGRPTIHAEHCTGCGVCLSVCPAPQNGVLLLPTLARSA